MILIILWCLLAVLLTLVQPSQAQVPPSVVPASRLSGVNLVRFSPDGKTLVGGRQDGTLTLWDVGTGRMLRSFPRHTSSVFGLCFRPDGKALACGYQDGTITLWDVGTGQPRWSLTGPARNVGLSFRPDGRTLASVGNTHGHGGMDSAIQLRDAGTGRLLRTIIGYMDAVTYLYFSPDGKILAGGVQGAYSATSGIVKLWDPMTGLLLRKLALEGGCAMSFSRDGNTLANGAGESDVGFSFGEAPIKISLWDATTGRPLKAISLPGDASKINCVCFSPAGKTLAVGLQDGTIRLCDVGTGQSLQTLAGSAGSS